MKKNKNSYIIEFNGKDYRFFINGVAHREDGPAIFLAEEADKYLKYDENIYLIKEVPLENNYNRSFISKMVSLTGKKEFYFLNDLQYEKEEFDRIILSAKLDAELPNKNIEIKKSKI